MPWATSMGGWTCSMTFWRRLNKTLSAGRRDGTC